MAASRRLRPVLARAFADVANVVLDGALEEQPRPICCCSRPSTVAGGLGLPSASGAGWRQPQHPRPLAPGPSAGVSAPSRPGKPHRPSASPFTLPKAARSRSTVSHLGRAEQRVTAAVGARSRSLAPSMPRRSTRLTAPRGLTPERADGWELRDAVVDPLRDGQRLPTRARVLVPTDERRQIKVHQPDLQRAGVVETATEPHRPAEPPEPAGHRRRSSAWPGPACRGEADIPSPWPAATASASSSRRRDDAASPIIPAATTPSTAPR